MVVIEIPRAARPNKASIEAIAEDDAKAGRSGNRVCPFSMRGDTEAWFWWWAKFLACGGMP